MKKTLFLTLILVSVLVFLIRYSGPAAELILGIKARSGISIISDPEGAVVFMESKEVGKTPYEDKNLDVKEYNVKLEKDGVSWQGKIKLTPKTLTIVNRDLAKSQASQSGEILTLERGKGMTVISNPSDSDLTSVSAPVITQTPEVEVIDTPTGFLRVRDKASTAGKEITRVNVGDTLILLEELSGWMRVRLSNGTEGFVSSTYVSKK